METITGVQVQKTKRSRIGEVDFSQLEFGQHLSDHMLVCDYLDNEWQQPLVRPLANLSLHPATLALHYGQTVFEGMKAFLMIHDRLNIFRMDKHYERFVRSLDRMCMEAPPWDIFRDGLVQLVATDRNWVPQQPGTALYLRPFVYASEARLGVKISEQYRFVVIAGPVPELYPKPIRVKVETEYIRAAKGGTGFAKCGGNYGAAFYPTKKAKEEGYDQVLWTDAREHRFIEESGTMNVFFVIRNRLVTPSLSDSILDGVTRDSLLTLAEELGYTTELRPVAVDELAAGLADRSITEVFGAGTAAVVAPIQEIGIRGIQYALPAIEMSSLQLQLKRKLEQIRSGQEADLYGWNTLV